MQVLVPDPRANYRNIIDALVRIVRHEGIARTVRGINVTAYGAGPAHAMYFACYEKMKGVLSRTGQSNHWAHGKYMAMHVGGDILLVIALLELLLVSILGAGFTMVIFLGC